MEKLECEALWVNDGEILVFHKPRVIHLFWQRLIWDSKSSTLRALLGNR